MKSPRRSPLTSLRKRPQRKQHRMKRSSTRRSRRVAHLLQPGVAARSPVGSVGTRSAAVDSATAAAEAGVVGVGALGAAGAVGVDEEGKGGANRGAGAGGMDVDVAVSAGLSGAVPLAHRVDQEPLPYCRVKHVLRRESHKLSFTTKPLTRPVKLAGAPRKKKRHTKYTSRI